MKKLFVTLVLAVLLTGTATAFTFQMTNVGSVLPFSGGVTNAYYNSGDGVRASLYADQTYATGSFHHTPSQTAFSTSWHNPHTVQYTGSGYNGVSRTLQPTGWQVQSAQVRTNQGTFYVAQNPHSGSYYGSTRIGSAPSPVTPITYRQSTQVYNPWGSYSNTHYYQRTPSAYVSMHPTNYW